MSNLSTRLQAQATTLRLLKLLVIVLGLSNVVLGLSSYLFLNVIRQNYSSLIGLSVPKLNDLQTLTVASVDALRSTGTSLLEAPVERRPDAIQKARAAFGRDRILRGRLVGSELLAARDAERREFQDSGDEFSQSGTEVLTLFANGNIAEANRLRTESLRPAFDRYLAATTRAADLLQQESLQMNNHLTTKAGTILAVTLGLTSWPMMVVGLALLVTVVLIVFLTVFPRARETSGLR